MKTLIILVTALLSSSVFACTNFSGNYRNDDGTTFSITQDQCNSVTLTQADTGPFTAYNDGQTHLSLKQDIIIQGQNVGTMSMYTKLAFVDTTLVLDLTLQVDAMGQSQTQTSHSVSSLNANGDMISVSTQDGQTQTTTATKIK